MSIPILLALMSTASAQDENPWGDLLEDTSEEEDAEEAPAPAEPSAPEPDQKPEPDSDNPWGDLLDEEEEEAAPPQPPAAPAPVPATPRPAPPPAPVSSTKTEAIEAMPPQGVRVAPMRPPTGVGLGQQFVLGGDGGTSMTTVQARYGTETFAVGARLPFAIFNTPDGRSTGLGHLRLEGWYFREAGKLLHGFGVEAHLSPTSRAYTWVNQADELWPGGGVDLLWQGQQQLTEATTLLYRGGLGLHGAQRYDPYPGVYFRLQGAVAADQALSDRFGIVGEASLAYWDTSPFDISVLGRAELFTGMRLRTGFVLPFFVWAGASPSSTPAGMREATWLFDLTMAL